MLLYFLLIAIGLLGLLTSLLVLTKYKLNRMMNLYLIILFFLVSIRFIMHGLKYLLHHENINDLAFNHNGIFILLIPCFYLYFKNLIDNIKSFSVKDFKHFIVPIIFFAIMLKTSSADGIPSVNWKLLSFVFLFIYSFIYCYLSYSMIIKKFWLKKNKKKILNKQDELIKKWTFFLLILSTLSITRVLIALYLIIFNDKIIRFSDDYYIWISSLVWMLIFLKILVTPEILYGYAVFTEIIKKEQTCKLELGNIWNIVSQKESKNIQDSKLKPLIDKNIIEYISRLETNALHPESFKNFKFTIIDLSQKLNIPTSHLNYIFKYHCQISFSDYKKTIRINHSIYLIQSGYLDINKLEALAKDVGFASYNPFYCSFKDIIGQSPKEYITQLKQ